MLWLWLCIKIYKSVVLYEQVYCLNTSGPIFRRKYNFEVPLKLALCLPSGKDPVQCRFPGINRSAFETLFPPPLFSFPVSSPCELQDSSASDSLSSLELSRLDRIGVWIETSMTGFFTWWGTLCARYPVPVIVLSVGFAAGLCTGMQWLEVRARRRTGQGIWSHQPHTLTDSITAFF